MRDEGDLTESKGIRQQSRNAREQDADGDKGSDSCDFSNLPPCFYSSLIDSLAKTSVLFMISSSSPFTLHSGGMKCRGGPKTAGPAPA